MLLKNEKGIAMGMAIIIGLVITITGIALWQASTNGTIQVEGDENRTQAYFYSKSGVELAVGLLQDNPDYLSPENPPVTFYGKLSDTAFSRTDTGDYNIKIEIERDDNNYFIRSTGIVNVAGAKESQATANSLGFLISVKQLKESAGIVSGGGGQVPPLDMIFSLGEIELTGSSQIVGNTGTNSVEPGSVTLTWSTAIDGLLYIGAGGDPATVINATNRPGNLPKGSALLPSTRSFPLPEFPEFPDLPSKGVMEAGWRHIPEGGFQINESGFYNRINVSNELTINIGEEDLLIRTENLSVSGDGKIKVNRTGQGRLILYVEDTFNINGSGKINANGHYNDVVMYYAGGGTPTIGGDTEFVGSIYALNSNFIIANSGGIVGHIVTGGNTLTVSGTADANVRALYAPHADLTVQGSGKIKGAVIAKSIKVLGDGRIYYDDSMNMDFFELLDWGTGEPVQSTTDWRTVGKWQRL